MSVVVPGLGLSPKLSSCNPLPTPDDGSPLTTEFELVAAIVPTSVVAAFGTPDGYRNTLLCVGAVAP